jgi:hypothetical protein
LEELMDWAEQAMREEEFAEEYFTALFAGMSRGCYHYCPPHPIPLLQGERGPKNDLFMPMQTAVRGKIAST